LHRQLSYVLDCDVSMSSLCFKLQNGHVILDLRVSLCMVFLNMFVTLFDFQNQFLFFLGGMSMSWGSAFFCLSIF
jgi:hypothetical protein